MFMILSLPWFIISFVLVHYNFSDVVLAYFRFYQHHLLMHYLLTIYCFLSIFSLILLSCLSAPVNPQRKPIGRRTPLFMTVGSCAGQNAHRGSAFVKFAEVCRE